MKAKRILAALLGGVMMLSMAACSNDGKNEGSSAGSSQAGEETADSLTIWAWDDTFNVAAAKTAIKYYAEKEPDIKVNVVSMAQDDIIQKLNAALSTGTYDGLPNITLIEDYRIQNFLTSYPGEIKELTGSVDPSKFVDYKLKFMTDVDKIYGVPFDSGVTALFYRTDIMEEAGYQEDDMKDLTWEKYIEIGKAVKEKTGKAMLTLDPSDIGQIRIMMQSAGEWYVKEDGETVNIKDNQALKDAVTIYKEMVDSGISKQVADWDSFVGAFQKGEVATVPSGCWIASSIKAADDQNGKWAVAPIPRLGNNEKSVNASNLGGASWYVLENVEGADTAVKFLAETFASNDNLMNDLVSEISLVSTLKSAGELENYKKENEFFGGQKIFEDFADWTEQIPAVNYGLHTYAVEDIMTEAVQSIVKGADMEKTLQNAQSQAEAAVG